MFSNEKGTLGAHPMTDNYVRPAIGIGYIHYMNGRILSAAVGSVVRLRYVRLSTIVHDAHTTVEALTTPSTSAQTPPNADLIRLEQRKPLYGEAAKKAPTRRKKPSSETKAKKKKEDEWSEWKHKLIAKLHAEYEEDRTRYSIEQNAITNRSRLVSYICDKRVVHMLSYVTRIANTLEKSDHFAYDDEFFAVALKFVALQFKRNWDTVVDTGQPWVESKEAESFFQNFSTFAEVLRPRGNDTRIAFTLSVQWANRWAYMPHNESRMDLNLAAVNLRRKLASALIGWSPVPNPVMFTNEEFKAVGEIAQHFFCHNILQRHYDQSGYDAGDSPLLASLETPAPSGEYLGSPFALPDKSEDDYIRLFCEQLTYEEEANVKAVNFSRTSKLVPMEAVVERWRWREAIATALNDRLQSNCDINLKTFLRNVDLDECAGRLLECVQAAMCKGQSLVSLAEIEYSVCRVILGLVRRHFLRSIACDGNKIYMDVFADYLKYYTIEDISRSHTIREWWSKCAASHKLPYDFYAPFADLFSRPPKELANVLIAIIMESCTIPAEVKRADKTTTSKRVRKAPRTKAFSYRNVMTEEESVLLIGDDKKTTLHKMIALHPRLTAAIEAHQFENLMFPCHMLPMKVYRLRHQIWIELIPPRPWTDFGTCGPFYTRPQEILRNLFDFRHMSVNVELKKRLKHAHSARPVFDALNDLGATPWVINRPMLAQLVRAFQFADEPSRFSVLSVLSVPRHPNTVNVPVFEEEFGVGTRVVDVNIERWRDFSKRQLESQKTRNELYSLWCSLLYRLLLAKHYENDCLYFPHNMDFRGRVYPISPHLNHMGDDINRGLLKFARGKALGSTGFDWLKLHCINMTGLMKREPIAARRAFAEERLPDMLDSAERPFEGDGWWLKSEEPWQTLAACMEIRDALACPDGVENFISHLPVHQDGSCNGLQHYAALGRDYQGGYQVNLVPNPVPTDVYSSVAERVEQKRIFHENNELIDLEALSEQSQLVRQLREAMPQAVPRKVLKQTVMTTVYGVTMMGAMQQIRRQLKALGLPVEQCLKFAPYLAQQTFACLDEAFTNSMKLKKWFQDCAKHTSQLHQPIQWVTPLGLPVVQPYVKAKKKFHLLYLEPARRKQTNAFPPNFVHSLDSTHMMLTTLHCRRRGITFAAVHDCFWTHACDVDALGRVCREQFIALHNEPIVQNFADFLQKTYLSSELVDSMSANEFQTFKDAFTSNFTTGTLEIEAIKDSVYFFS